MKIVRRSRTTKFHSFTEVTKASCGTHLSRTEMNISEDLGVGRVTTYCFINSPWRQGTHRRHQPLPGALVLDSALCRHGPHPSSHLAPNTAVPPR